MSADKKTLARSLKISLFIWWLPYILINYIFMLLTPDAGFDYFLRVFSEEIWDYFIFGLIPIAIIYSIVYKAIKIGLLNEDPSSLKMSLFVTSMEFVLSLIYLFLYSIVAEVYSIFDTIGIITVLFLFVIPINFIFIRAYKLLRRVIGKIRKRNDVSS